MKECLLTGAKGEGNVTLHLRSCDQLAVPRDHCEEHNVQHKMQVVKLLRRSPPDAMSDGSRQNCKTQQMTAQLQAPSRPNEDVKLSKAASLDTPERKNQERERGFYIFSVKLHLGE